MLTVGVDSYVDIAGADAYFAGRLYTDAWNTATPEQKEKALKQATRAIDRLPLIGRPVDLAQPLAFPRCYLAPGAPPSERRFDLPAGWWCETEVPQAVKDATCEEALALLERGNSERRRLQQEGVTSMSLGGLSESYAPGAGRGLISVEAQELMRPYIAGAVGIC